MRNIGRIFAGDIKLAMSNNIAILVLVGLCLVPALCAWFNIAGSWDPYGNTGNLKVAVANEDQGYAGELMPVGVNIGDKVSSSLHANDDYDWTFVGSDEAVEGVKAGRYYAAIVIPADFSSKLMTVLSSDAEKAQVTYYTNLKENPTAPASVAEGEASVAEGVRAVFSKSVDDAAVNALSDILTVADSDEVQTAVSNLVGRLDAVVQSLNVTAGQVRGYANLIDSSTSLTTSAAKALSGTGKAAGESGSAIGTAAAELTGVASSVRDAASALSDAVDKMNVSEGSTGSTARGLVSDANNLADSSEKLAQDALSASETLTKTIDGLSGSTTSLNGDLTKVSKQLKKMAKSIEKSATEVTNLSEEIVAALSDGDLGKLTALVQSSPDTVARLLAAPVSAQRFEVYSVESYGSAMAPTFTVLALWLGAVLLVLVMRVNVSQRRMAQLDRPRNFQLYLGRFIIFALVALLQATIVWAGDIFFLRIQCENPAMFLVSCWACAFVFCNVAYTLAVSFGGMGKALCVILLVMQVVGLGGEYPAQMLGGLFQVINPLLPFAHGVGAMQECIAGLYANTYIVDIQRLLLFLVPSLILGLALRTPLAHAANYVQSQLDRTGVM